MSYQYWQPQVQSYQQQPHQTSYYNYNGIPYPFNATPSPSNSSGYGSDVSSLSSPMGGGYPITSPYNTPAQSLWYPPETTTTQPRAAKRARTTTSITPDTQELISQIFTDSPTPLPPPKREYKRKVRMPEEAKVVQEQEDDEEEESETTPFLGNLDDLDEFDSFDMNEDSGSGVGEKKKRVLNRQQRLAANVRERQRMNKVNDSFVKLRQALPITTGRKRRKMSRLDIVMGALEYIGYLETLLESEGPVEINFEAYKDSIYFY